eukprot:TRINITY_DN11992_c0_g1_i2.p1 TRINITY_DN11992_c0_g1~~TRINITY_DN11992_c0_g1_i2.p1  ORF type:complete len:475 (+),score=92.80 TRINITY_DN11992_c0_g1_i2:310-1734(+)
MSMLQKNYLMSTIIQGRRHKLFQLLNTPARICPLCDKTSSFHSIISKNMRSRYYMKQENYDAKVIFDAMVNEYTHFVSVFKDYLIFDDINEFLGHYYEGVKTHTMLKALLNFYHKNTRSFPSYIALIPENKLLFRNIEEKQKIIDECNAGRAKDIKEEKKLFDSKFINEIHKLSAYSNFKPSKNTSKAERSLLLTDLLDAFVSKDTILQSGCSFKFSKDISSVKQPLEAKQPENAIDNEKSKLELRLSRNLATRLGFKTNREEVMVTPIEVIAKMSTLGRSSVLNPRNACNLTKKASKHLLTTNQNLKKFDTINLNSKQVSRKAMNSKERHLHLKEAFLRVHKTTSRRHLTLLSGSEHQPYNPKAHSNTRKDRTVHGMKDNRRNTIKPKTLKIKLAPLHHRILHKTGKSQPDLMKPIKKKELVQHKDSIKESLQEIFKSQLIQELRNKPLKSSKSLGNFRKKKIKAFTITKGFC